MAKNKLFGIVPDLDWAQLQNKRANPQIPLSINPSTSYFCSNTQVAPSQNTVQYLQTSTSSPISKPSSLTSTTQHFYENFDLKNVQDMYWNFIVLLKYRITQCSIVTVTYYNMWSKYINKQVKFITLFYFIKVYYY